MTPTAAPTLSFIIPVRDDATRLEQCLRRIAESAAPDSSVEMVVADNGSTDASPAVARRLGATLLDLPGLRVSELRNRAAAEARGQILAFVDADHEIAPTWIPAAVEMLQRPDIGAVGAPCNPPVPSTWVQRLYDRLRRHPEGRERVEWLGSGNLAVRRDAFDAVDGFDTTLETCEDVDLCRKLRAHGYVLVADSRMRNVHHGDPQTLGQVFAGELWRGRDNVRVSLRPPLSRRTLASAVVPVINLTAAGLTLVGLLTRSRGGLLLAAGSAAVLLLMVALRAALMLRPSWTSEWARALAVAAAYEAGRALAIAGRFGYRRRRRPVAERAAASEPAERSGASGAPASDAVGGTAAFGAAQAAPSQVERAGAKPPGHRMTSVLELRSVRGTGGGPEKTILHGAVRHDPHRFAVTVCYLRDRRDDVFAIDARARVLGLDYVEVAERHSFDPDIWRQLARLARRRRFDIIHGHDYKTNLLAWLLARRTRAVALATSHGWTGQSWRERRVYYPADRRVLRRFRRVVAVSSHVRDDLAAAGVDRSRVTVLLNGIDPQAFRRHGATRERMRAQLGFPPGDEVIGAVGRLERQKRFDLLLEAFAILRRNRPGLRLVVVGDGSLRRDLRRQAVRLDLGDDCRFLGHRIDIAELHSAFDVFVQSSEYEGTPNAVLEAMAMETPLVATDVGGTRELARPGVDGLLVPPGSVEAIRTAVASVLDDPIPAMARVLAARDRVEHELSFAERTRRLEAIYDDLLTRETPHPRATGFRPGLGVPHA